MGDCASNTARPTRKDFLPGDVVELIPGAFDHVKTRIFKIEDIKETGSFLLDTPAGEPLSGLWMLRSVFKSMPLNRYRINDEVLVSSPIPSQKGIFSFRSTKVRDVNILGGGIAYRLEIDNGQYLWREDELEPFRSFTFNLADYFNPDEAIPQDYEVKISPFQTWPGATGVSDIKIVPNTSWDGLLQQFNQLKQQNNESRLQNKNSVVAGGNRCTGRAVCCRRSKITVERGHLSHKEISGRR